MLEFGNWLLFGYWSLVLGDLNKGWGLLFSEMRCNISGTI
jgi:hypothetical protein